MDKGEFKKTRLIPPSSGEAKNNFIICTYLFFSFGGGWGHFIVFFGLKDLFHKATYSERSTMRNKERCVSLKSGENVALFNLLTSAEQKGKKQTRPRTMFVFTVEFLCRPLK